MNIRKVKCLCGAIVSAAITLGLSAEPIQTAFTVEDVWCGTGATGKILLQNRTLDDLEVIGGSLAGKDFSGVLDATAFHAFRTNGVYDVQLQARAMANWTYVHTVKVRLWQDGADIRIRALGARDHYLPTYFFGDDFSLPYALNSYDKAVTTSADNYCFGVKSLKFVARAGTSRTKRIVTTPVEEGVFAADGEAVVLQGDGVCATAGVFAQPLSIAGGVAFEKTVAPLTISSSISGENGWLTLGPGIAQAGTNSIGNVLETALEWSPAVVLTNRRLSEVIGFSDVVQAGGDSQAFWFENDGRTAEVQFQRQHPTAGYVMCTYVKFKQVGTDVKAWRAAYYYHFTNNGGTLGEDFRIPDRGQVEGGTYALTSLAILTKDNSRIVFAPTANTAQNLRLVVETNACVLAKAGSLPVGGEATRIKAGGVLAVSEANAIGEGNGIVVEKGGLFRQDAAVSVFTESSRLVLSGGTVEFSTDGEGICKTYLNYLTSFGGVLHGNSPRAGTDASSSQNDGGAIWHISGCEPTYLESGLSVVGVQMQRLLKVIVDDVTGDDRADFVVANRMVYDDGASSASPKGGVAQAARIVKMGSGTWKFAVSCPALTGSLRIDEGTVELAANDCFRYLGYAGTVAQASRPAFAEPGLQLNGGCLACAAGTTTTIEYPIAVKKNSSVVVADGATLSFADSSSKAWSSDAVLSITAPENSVRFGSDEHALTSAQIRKIRMNGHRVVLNGEGYLTPAGLILMVR